MKALLALCLFVAASLANASTPAAVVKGEVLETLNSGGYTYLRLKTRDGETWAAVNRATVSKGAEVTLENAMEMRDFESRSLKKTFPKILFASLAGSGGSSAGMAATPSAHAKARDVGDVQVPRATGANARTVAEIITKSGELKDKPVVVRAKVVKYNAGIMGKNWLHVRDGSGNAAADTHDVLVTTTQQASVGDVVTVQGVVRINKDFGAGYVYKVLIEEATLQR